MYSEGVSEELQVPRGGQDPMNCCAVKKLTGSIQFDKGFEQG